MILCFHQVTLSCNCILWPITTQIALVALFVSNGKQKLAVISSWSLKPVVMLCTTGLDMQDSALCLHSVFTGFMWFTKQHTILLNRIVRDRSSLRERSARCAWQRSVFLIIFGQNINVNVDYVSYSVLNIYNPRTNQTSQICPYTTGWSAFSGTGLHLWN